MNPAGLPEVREFLFNLLEVAQRPVILLNTARGELWLVGGIKAENICHKVWSVRFYSAVINMRMPGSD